MKNKADFLVTVLFFSIVGFGALKVAYNFYSGANLKWQRGQQKIDSLNRVCKFKKGTISKVFLAIGSAEKTSLSSYPLELSVSFEGSDSSYSIPNFHKRLDSGDFVRIKYLSKSEMGKSSIIELWKDNRYLFTPTDFLKLEPPSVKIPAIIMVFGLVIIGVTIPLAMTMIKFTKGWIKLREEIRNRNTRVSKITDLQIKLLELYHEKWEKEFRIRIMAGIIMTAIIFFVPAKFIGLRQILHHSVSGGGNETIGEVFGFIPTLTILTLLVNIYYAEFVLGKKALRQDIKQALMFSITGELVAIFRDAKDNNQLKANVKTVGLEFEAVEIPKNHNYIVGSAIDIDVALNSFQIIGISNKN
ncbi:MAG: hypothetical protein ACK514_00370 [Bacteroidota bacterium]|nr:hypothetical protein [Cytophagales bacterium]MCE2956147.1 hypothetical protein [Flammeovirgaceae bacterium]